jgi:hypothetical protein
VRHSTGNPTKSQQARFQALKELGCICCWNYVGKWRAPEIHHIVEGMKRLGHDFTLPLCEYHHRGVSTCRGSARAHLGPSLADGKRVFVDVFGTERQLLETVNAMLERA